MLANGEFVLWFWLTLKLFGGLAVLIGIIVGLVFVFRQWSRFWAKYCLTWFAQRIDDARRFLSAVISLIWRLLTVLIGRPWQAIAPYLTAFFSAFFRTLGKVPWGAVCIGCVLLLALGGLPIIIFMMKGIPIGSISKFKFF